MALLDDMKSFVSNTFGEFSAAKVDQFAKDINPNSNPKEFIDKCADFLSTILGEQEAKNRLNKFYQQYS